MNSLRRFIRSLPAALLAAASLTCGGDNLVLPKEGEPAAIAVIHGNNQSGTVGAALAESLIVRVTDSKNRPVVSAGVRFTLVTNVTGGDVVPDTAITDQDGQARARWFLGTSSGAQTVQARVIGFTNVNVTITATAAPDVADTVILKSGDGQSGTVGQALAESLVVRVNDRFGNPVGGTSVGWTVSGGGSVSPTTVITGANGEAAVQRVLGIVAGAQSATATIAGVNGSPVVFSHTAVAGGPTALLKTSGDNQTAPAGTFLAESLQVRVVDGLGNGVAGRSVAFTPSPSNGSAGPTSAVTDVNGYAAARWTLGAAAGAQSLIASSVGFSVTFDATATSDVPTAMAISAGNNQTATAGTAVPVDPAVRVRDSNNNGVGNVSVTFTVTGGGGTVAGPSGSGTSTVVATNSSGIATLTSWTLGVTAGANTLSATATGPGGPLQGSPLTFDATGAAGSASQITITTEPPTSAASGATLSTAPVVQLRDAGGNPVNRSGVNITVSLGLGGGTLNGTKTQSTNASGQATFNGLSITGPAGPYTLDFNSGSLTGATSTTINLTAGAATRLFLTTQPSGAAQSGVAFAQQPVVQLQDGAGNPVSQSGVVVTAVIASGGGTLNGTTTATTNSSGTATFTDLAITGAAGGRTLDFTAPGLTKATSTLITIGAGGATKLAFGVQPTNTAAGSAISPAVTVLVQDASGNTVAGATNTVTIALGANPGSSTLSGTLSVNAVNGVATFADLSLDKVGTGYTLAASSSGLTGATSATFNVPAGSATQLVFTQQPSSVVAGASISPAVTVTAKDAQNNTVTSYATPVSLTLGNNPGGATLSGGAAVTPVNGVATFPAVSLNRTGTGYTLVANSGTLNQISTAFNVSAGSPSQLVFTQQPSNSVAGSSIAPAVQVSVRDALGNTVTSATTSITVAIGANPPGNGVLSGTKTVNAVAGVATFGNLSIDKPGTGYTITADGGSLPTATSSSFDISVGSGNQLVFIVDPTSAQVGQVISPSVQVQIQDAVGNPVGGTNAVTLVIGNNPGGATLTGGGPVSAVNGIATFNNVRLNRAGSGYTLTALASGLVSATSASFDITPAATTTTINTDNPDPSRVGQDITVTFTVAVSAPGSGSPTGLVTVSDGAVSCQASVAAGQCTLTPTVAGAKTITAAYAGDANFGGSASAGTSHQVNAAATTMVITSDSPEPSVVGQAVTVNFTLSVNAPGNGTPTGNVTVSSGTDTCVVPVSAGTCSLVLTSAGAKTINAAYAGDGNFNPSQDNEAHTVSKAATTTTITSDLPDPSGSGEAVTVNFTVVANAPGSGTPTGNVTVSDGTVSCQASVATGTCQLTPTTVGAKTLTATYPGDANNLSSSDTELHDVTTGSTTTAITSTTPGPSVVGQPVTIQYTVTPASGGTPTGTVTVTDGTQSCNASVAAGQCAISFSSAGPRSLTASYAGDANFTGSTSPAFGHQVNTASTTTAITGDNPDPSTVGAAYTVSYSVSVTAPGGGTPTGNVLVSDGLDTCTGTVAAGSCSLTSSTTGTKTLTASYQGDGNYTGSNSSGTSHDVTAGAVSPSQSSVTVNTSTITASTGSSSTTVTVTALDASNNPISGATVVLAVTGSGNSITQPGLTNASGVATGTVSSTIAGSKTISATINGTGINQTQAVTVDPGPVDAASSTGTVPAGASGVPTQITVQGKDQFGNNVTTGGATVMITVSGTNSVGPFAATDNGDGTWSGSYTPSTAGPDQVDITLNGTPISGSPFNTTVALGTASKIQLFAGDNQSAPIGTPVAVNPAVIVRDAGNNPIPGVTVGFAVTGGGGSITSSSAVTNGSGVAEVGWTLGLTAGGNGLTASATGLTGSPVLFSATATAGSTAISIVSHAPDPSLPGQGVTVSYAVSSATGTPTGTVTVSDGVDSCNGTVAGGSCVVALNTTGARTLVASYAGDANFAGSQSPGVAHTVSASPTTTTITAHSPDPSVVGQGITVDLTVASGGGTPAGTVTVDDGTDNCTATLSAGSGSCVLTPSTPGAKTLTASYGGGGGFAGSQGTASHQVDPFGAVSASLSTVAVSPGSITASTGSSATTITVTARDDYGNLISGATVLLQASGGSGDNLVQPAAATGGNGQAAGTFSATGSGSRSITASVNGVAINQTGTVVVDPDILDAASSTATVPDGQSGQVTTMVIQGRDQFGNALTTGGGSATFVVTGSNAAQGSFTDNGDGTYTAAYTPLNSGTDSVAIFINSQPIQSSPYTSTIS